MLAIRGNGRFSSHVGPQKLLWWWFKGSRSEMVLELSQVGKTVGELWQITGTCVFTPIESASGTERNCLKSIGSAKCLRDDRTRQGIR